MGMFGSLFRRRSRPAQQIQMPRFSPQQQDLQSQMLSQLGPLMQQLLQPQQQIDFDFAPIAQQARTQFREETIPGLAERFTSMGGGAGGQRSSAFQGALGKAGAGLEQGLAGMQSQYDYQSALQDRQMQQQRQMGLLSSLMGGGMQSPFENLYVQRQPSQPGFLQNMALGGAQAGMKALGNLGLPKFR